jgi:hypothetical protein
MKNALLQYNCKQNKPNQLRRITDDSGFGIGIFCSIVSGLEKEKIIIDLELDRRGSISKEAQGLTIIVNVGEIKSSLSLLNTAKLQVRRRLINIDRPGGNFSRFSLCKRLLRHGMLYLMVGF